MDIAALNRTIAAPITAAGVSAVSVVRVSGPETKQIVSSLLENPERVFSKPRSMVYCDVADPADGASIDSSLIAFFPGPNSFTGEDVCEINLHGSPYLLSRLMEVLYAQGAMPAEPGEFSKQAFLNGKLDLSQTEAIADLIAAETEAQARVAKEQLEGKLSGAISNLGEPVRNLVAEIEAYIDFPDEDINPESEAGWKSRIEEVQATLKSYMDTFRHGRLCREGASVALCGLPNAGKSSLLNKLVGEERAIVTPIAGTTRDFIEERVSLDGLLVKFWDTAGLVDENSTEHSPDEIEVLGIERSWERLERSDLVLYVFDASSSFDSQLSLFDKVSSRASNVIVVANKQDLLSETQHEELISSLGSKRHVVVSAISEHGLDSLRTALREQLLSSSVESGSVLVTNERHYSCLKTSSENLTKAQAAISQKRAPELIALDVREAASALDDIIGVTQTEDLLGRIFSKFCIGK